jgi:hypothetical protein
MVDGDPANVTEARLVCDEMARRCRSNIEVLVTRLTEQRFRFHSNDDGETPVVPFTPAGAESPAIAEWLADRFGPVPLTLSSWVRHVGDVWLVGTHPEWQESCESDPLVIEIEGSRYPGHSMRDYFEEEAAMWREAVLDGDTAFVLPVAPDRLHKANISGGSPYGFVLPDHSVDATFAWDRELPFVEYLNDVFRNGGFPAAASSNEGQGVQQSLARGLLPL